MCGITRNGYHAYAIGFEAFTYTTQGDGRVRTIARQVCAKSWNLRIMNHNHPEMILIIISGRMANNLVKKINRGGRAYTAYNTNIKKLIRRRVETFSHHACFSNDPRGVYLLFHLVTLYAVHVVKTRPLTADVYSATLYNQIGVVNKQNQPCKPEPDRD